MPKFNLHFTFERPSIAHCKIRRKTIILNALINLQLFNTLISNFAYIHSKRRKLGMFILFQKSQFVYPNNVNSPQIRQCPSFSSFGHVTCHVTIIKQENLMIYFWGRILSFLGLLARDTANHSYAQNTGFDPGLKPLELENY